MYNLSNEDLPDAFGTEPYVLNPLPDLFGDNHLSAHLNDINAQMLFPTLDLLYTYIEGDEPNKALSVANALTGHQLNEAPFDTKDRDPIIITAVQAGYLDIINCLLNKPDFNWGVKDANGHNALHHAVAVGTVEVVLYLLNNPLIRNALLHQEGKEGTPLELATKRGDPNIYMAIATTTLNSLREYQVGLEQKHQAVQQEILIFTQRVSRIEQTIADTCAKIEEVNAHLRNNA